MIIEKITLDNFRIHEHLEFEPVANGINSINGNNGAGKSTIVDAFSWALFGTRLHGLKNAAYIKEGIDPKDKDVKVVADIKIENRKLRVVRQITNIKGTTSCWVYSLKNDKYEEVAGPAVTHAETYIRRELGLDQDGFLTSVFIQQKQVDEIVNATPAQRSKTIERLIGIDAISNGIKQAKEDARDLQKSANNINRGNLTEIEEEIDIQQEKLDLAKKELDRYKKEYIRIEKKHKDLEDYIEKEDNKKTSYNNKENEYRNKKSILKELKSSINADYELFQKIKKRTVLVDNIEDLEKEKEVLTEKKKDIDTKVVELGVLIKHNEEILKNEINKKLIEKEEELRTRLDEFINMRNKTDDEISVCNAEVKRLNNYIKMIDKGISKCPTCGGKIETKESHKIEIEKELEENKLSLNKLLSNKEKIIKNIDKANGLINGIENQKLILEKQDVAQKELKEQRNNIKDLKSTKIEIDTKLSVIQNKIDEYNDNKRNQEFRKELVDKIKTQEEKYEEDLEYLKEEAIKLKEEQNTLDSNLPDKKREFKMLDKEYKEVYANKNTFKERVKQEEEKIVILNRQYEENKKAEKEYQLIINNLNIINQSIETLSKFKEDRLYKSIPKLTASASDILYKFTEGDFVELILDDKFNCSVKTKKGQIRSVEQLSGGELSSAAIALRLAISLFLSNSSDNLLIMDEVLVSLTEERAKLALEVISSIENTQIILIAHSGYANEMADKIINL